MHTDTITTIFTSKGQTKSQVAAYQELISSYGMDPYAKKKAAGSLGGSIKSGYLSSCNGYYRRTR